MRYITPIHQLAVLLESTASDQARSLLRHVALWRTGQHVLHGGERYEHTGVGASTDSYRLGICVPTFGATIMDMADMIKKAENTDPALLGREAITRILKDHKKDKETKKATSIGWWTAAENVHYEFLEEQPQGAYRVVGRGMADWEYQGGPNAEFPNIVNLMGSDEPTFSITGYTSFNAEYLGAFDAVQRRLKQPWKFPFGASVPVSFIGHTTTSSKNPNGHLHPGWWYSTARADRDDSLQVAYAWGYLLMPVRKDVDKSEMWG